MLEIKNVHKTYTPTKGVPVKALNGVSLAFEDKGMVFILGKSGSGKSTLLNVLGGLDVADSGEFIIKGKSSKNFSQSDFDSYRNTFIGFIFQEYNILNEFTVAQNIALAMELQGKKATNEALNAILEEVDLVGYGNRKPNELSGGQKQRVAIARALIKNPEMIMADEPTGALDSNTGKQVFDTLKKLSKDKLVLIVSHDRDFAELYADRIIELKDGKILSDVSKNNIPPTIASEGVSVIDDKIIQVKKGYTLTKSDIELISSYIANAQCDTIISVDAQKTDDIKKTAKINDQGGKDAFLDTTDKDVTLKSYTPEDSKLIKSRLPYRNSLKIGASSLKVKPFRLVLTIFLCFIAFTLFGLADTMASFSKTNSLISSMTDEKIAYSSFQKVYRTKTIISSYDNQMLLNDDDIKKIKEQTNKTVYPVYSPNYGQLSLDGAICNRDNLSNKSGFSIYNANIAGYVHLDDAYVLDNHYSIIGSLPKNDYEITITKFLYDQIKLGGLKYYEQTKDENDNVIYKSKELESSQIHSENDILNKLINATNLGFPNSQNTLTDSETPYVKIVGVIDTKFDTTPYKNFLPDAPLQETGLVDIIVQLRFSDEFSFGPHGIIAVTNNMLNKIIEFNNNRYFENKPPFGATISEQNYLEITNGSGFGYSLWNFNEVATLSQLNDNINSNNVVWVNGAKSSLNRNEIIVPYSLDYQTENEYISENILSAMEEKFNFTYSDDERNNLMMVEIFSFGSTFYMSAISQPPTNFLKEDFLPKQGITEDNLPKGYASLDEYLESQEFKDSLYYEARNEYINFVMTADTNPYNEQHTKNFYRDMYCYALTLIQYSAIPKNGNLIVNLLYGDNTESIEYDIVGYYAYASDNLKNGNVPIVVADSIYQSLTSQENGTYAFALTALDAGNKNEVTSSVNFSNTSFNGYYYTLKNGPSAILDFVGNLIEMLSSGFLYLGIGLAVFASLMMFNFITISINHKKREIGILRAVGAKSSDVFGIFFNESMIIAIINFVLSATATVIVSIALSDFFRDYLPITILSFGLRQLLLMFGISVLVAFVSSFLPVMRISRKRPIDAIQNR